ncbi:hypothetical protein ET495_13395 [Xylanimonas allomyrinae]|uniref:Uncharacterized protein n=1 Tax=Xylanimonas allomyrinae TaxID=2509459 RepID=A0A4P6EMF7_9MICO|nr:hypothetical protein [Xylanimonas allomyrinae]QAY64050.1 hypothetical protein ET495_13395 [Xylanimonas allomyrinae]
MSDVHLDARGVGPRSPWQVEEARADGLVTFATVERLLASQLGSDLRLAPDPGEPDGLAITWSALGLEIGAVVKPGVVDDSTIGVQVSGLLLGVSVSASRICRAARGRS